MRAGFIGRFKPLHNGGAIMLEHILRTFDHLTIGIGSSNKYDYRNPFTAEESEEMLEAFLAPRFNNYSIIHVPDFGHIPEYRDGRKWVEYVVEHFGDMDRFITSNQYTSLLLEPHYIRAHPAYFIPVLDWVKIKGSFVRYAMAKGIDWEYMVPEKVVEYMKQNGLVERLRKKFGSEILLQKNPFEGESFEEEKRHVQNG